MDKPKIYRSFDELEVDPDQRRAAEGDLRIPEQTQEPSPPEGSARDEPDSPAEGQPAESAPPDVAAETAGSQASDLHEQTPPTGQPPAASSEEHLRSLLAGIERRRQELEGILEQTERQRLSLLENQKAIARQEERLRGIASDLAPLKMERTRLRRDIARHQRRLERLQLRIREQQAQLSAIRKEVKTARLDARTLARREESLRERESECGEILKRGKKLDSLAKNLERRARSQEKTAAALAANTKKAEARLVELKTAARDLAARERSLKPREDDLTRRETDAAAAEQRHARTLRENRDLRTRLRKAVADNSELHGEIGKQTRTLQRKDREIERLERLADRASGLFVRDAVIRDWLAATPRKHLALPREIVTVGCEPYDLKEFGEFLAAAGFSARSIPQWDCEIVVVGREDWTPAGLEDQIDERAGTTLRIYSQEMFVAMLATGRDPLGEPCDPELLEAFADGHPALEYLHNSALEWPRTTAPESSEELNFAAAGMADESPLAKLGYHVGKTAGRKEPERHRILQRAFEGELPWVTSDEYMKRWAKPGTRRRLKTLANLLGWLARSKSTLPSHRQAVNEWQADLAWIKEKYYDKHMRFAWPDIRVGAKSWRGPASRSQRAARAPAKRSTTENRKRTAGKAVRR